MRCFVTGATGFVGSHLTRRLVDSGAQVAILVRDPVNPRRIADLKAHVTMIQGDLSSIRRCAEAVKEFEPDTVFHLGWSGANSYQHQNKAEQVFQNVDGSLELVRIAAQAGCRKLVGLGSVIEYGNLDRELREDVPAIPENLYGAAKYGVGLLSAGLCKSYGLGFAWLRLSWGYGPDDDAARMVPHVIQMLLERKRPALTPGEQLWDYLYIDDAVEAILAVANTSNADGVFNLGHGEPRKIRDVVEIIRDAIDPALPIGLGDIPYRENQPMLLKVNIDRLIAATGWRPKVTLEAGLKRAVESYRRA